MPNETWITTASNKRIFPLALKPEDIDIDDIAHALSNVCRWGGHIPHFYSVAQHSVLVSEISFLIFREQRQQTGPVILPRIVALYGLLHDAAEAYLGDVCRPLKHDTGNATAAAYKAAEENALSVILDKFELQIESMPSVVALADNVLLKLEAKQFNKILASYDEDTGNYERYFTPKICLPVEPKEAKRRFLRKFAELTE